MSKKKKLVTAAIRILRTHNINFTEHLFDYEEKGGTAQGASALGVDEHLLVKTLIMEDDQKNPLVVLMHGDLQVSTKKLARFIGVKSISPCEPNVANKHSGYVVGGTSPFATRRIMPVFMEASILQLPCIYINGGRRGYLLGIKPNDIERALSVTLVQVGV